MTENTNIHLATFKCIILDSSCRETRRSKFCSKELTFLAGSQANISTAERSRGDRRWRESHGEPGPRRESLDCWTGSQHQSQDSSSAPKAQLHFWPISPEVTNPRGLILSKRQCGESLRACPRIQQPGVSWSLSWIWEERKVSVFIDGEQMLGKGFMPSQGLLEEVSTDLRHHMTDYPATAISLFL